MSDDVKQFFTGEAAEQIPRDRWGRPQIKQLDGSKPIAYQRVTTFVGPLEDTSNLTLWKQRQTVLGLMQRPALQMAVAAAQGDKKKLNALMDECMEAAGSSDAATLGTALHKFTEDYDRGLDISIMPPTFQPDLQAYVNVTAQFEMLAVEQFVVVDELKVAGTTDRLLRFRGGDGQIYIGDVKTGSIEWGAGKMAMQLAVYAHGKGYNPETGERYDLGPVNQTSGVIIHLPAGTGTCSLHWVNIAAGWEAATQLATGVQAWRKRRDLMKPFIDPAPAANPAQPVLEAPAVVPVAPVVVEQNPPGTQAAYTALAGEIDAALLANIAGAIDANTLKTLWELNKAVWEPHHTAAAKARTAELVGVQS